MRQQRFNIWGSETRDLSKEDFGIVSSLIGRKQWNADRQEKGVQKQPVDFLGQPSQSTLSWSIPVCKKLNRHGRWPNWLNKELLTELKNKNIRYGR